MSRVGPLALGPAVLRSWRYHECMVDSERERVAAGYLGFARHEAAGKSAIYERCAEGVATSEQALSFLLALPPEKRQPNLLFAALRFLEHPLHGIEDIEHALAEDADGVRRCMQSSWTQTNEPGRCAVLLPYLARLPQPLYLIEVGAAGGLCLYPDRYAYTDGTQRVGSHEPQAPLFPCEYLGRDAAPQDVPEVVGRIGIDRAPIDLRDDDQVRWLQTLVWPEQRERAARLEQAIETVRLDPPTIVEGDLIDGLPALVADAPHGATIVVFHTAVLCYVEPERRRIFEGLVASLPVTWISNEDPRVFPDVVAPAAPREPAFVIAVDGHAVATADPHGAWVAAV